jgi:hypothetical protein
MDTFTGNSERWLPIVGYEGLYEVSDQGRVRRVRDGRLHHFGRSKGYFNVTLTKDKQLRTFTVHRLMAIAFHGIQHGKVIRHMDGNMYNNTIDNLAWGTAQDNADDRERHGTVARGIKIPHAKRTPELVKLIKELSAQGKGPSEIGRIVGLNKARVHEITSGKIWAHIT